MNNIKRGSVISLISHDCNKFSIKDKYGNVLKESETDYIIYMKNVTFKNNIIKGVYLGILDDNDVLVNIYESIVNHDNLCFKLNGKSIGYAKMVVVNNKNNVLISLLK